MRLVSLGIDGLRTAAMCGHEPRHIGGPRGLGGPLMTLPGTVKHTECAGIGGSLKENMGGVRVDGGLVPGSTYSVAVCCC